VNATPRLLYPKTWYPLYMRLGRPQGRSGRVRKLSPPPPGFDPRTNNNNNKPLRPLCSWPSYWPGSDEDTCLFHSFQNHSGDQPTSYPAGTRGFSLWCKAAGEWSWPVTSIYSSAEVRNERSHTSMNNVDLLISLHKTFHAVMASVILWMYWQRTETEPPDQPSHTGGSQHTILFVKPQQKRSIRISVCGWEIKVTFLWLVQHPHHEHVWWNGGIAPRVLKLCSGLSESFDTHAGRFRRLGGSQQWRTEGGGWGVQPPHREIPKALQNRAKLNPTVKT